MDRHYEKARQVLLDNAHPDGTYLGTTRHMARVAGMTLGEFMDEQERFETDEYVHALADLQVALCGRYPYQDDCKWHDVTCPNCLAELERLGVI